MQLKKAVISSVVGIGMGAAAFAGAGSANATNDNWHPGDGNWQPGAAVATFSANVKLANGNLNGNLNGVKIFSGNSISVLNGNKILSGNSFLNGNFSNNLINTGANSFNDSHDTTNNVSVVKVWKYDNSTRTWVKVSITDSFNETNTTTTTNGCVETDDGNNGHGNDCDHNDEGNPGGS